MVYRIKKAEEYVRQISSDAVVDQNQNKAKEIIHLEVFKKIEVPAKWNYLETDIFTELFDGYWDDYTPIHVDNKGNVIFYFRVSTI